MGLRPIIMVVEELLLPDLLRTWEKVNAELCDIIRMQEINQ